MDQPTEPRPTDGPRGSLAVAVVDAVADREGVDAMDLEPPLYDVVVGRRPLGARDPRGVRGRDRDRGRGRGRGWDRDRDQGELPQWRGPLAA